MAKKARAVPVLTSLLLAVSALTGSHVHAVSRVSQATTTIVWYDQSNPQQNTWERQMITAFEKIHPEINVQLQIVPWAQFDPKLSALWAAGNAPDVWSHWGASGFRDYLNRGMLLDQTAMIKRDAAELHLSDIPLKLQHLYTVAGKTYGIPTYSYGTYVFYNVDLFKQANVAEPPTSWDDKSWTWAALVDDAKKLTSNYGDIAKAQYGITWGMWPTDALPRLWGVHVFDASAYTTGIPATNHIAAPGSVAAFQAVADLTFKDKVQPSPALMQGFQMLSDPMLSRRIAMDVTGGWEFYNLRPAKFHWSIAPLPWVKTNQDITFSDPWFIARTSKHPKEAWEFVKFLTGLQGDSAMAQDLLLPPSHQSLLPLWYKQFPGVPVQRLQAVYLGSMKYGSESSNHMLANYGQMDTVLGQDIQPINLGKKSAAQQLPVAQADLDRVLKSMQK